MCQSKQMILIGLIFGICIVAAISLTAAYFVLWHYRGQPKSQPSYQIGTTVITANLKCNTLVCEIKST